MGLPLAASSTAFGNMQQSDPMQLLRYFQQQQDARMGDIPVQQDPGLPSMPPPQMSSAPKSQGSPFLDNMLEQYAGKDPVFNSSKIASILKLFGFGG